MAVLIGDIVFEEIYSYTDLISLREYVLMSWYVTYRDGGQSPTVYSICESVNGGLKSDQGMPL